MASGFIDNGFIKFGFSDAGTLGYGSNKTPGIFYDSTGKANYPANADFLTPGSPRESFSVKVGSTVFSNRNESYTNPSMPTKVTTDLITTGGKTFGTVTAVSTINGLEITQKYSVDADDTIINMSVTVKNVSSATINNVKYSRGIDPDVDSPLGTTTTNNSQGTTGVSKNDLVLSEGPISHRIIGYYSNDPMAHNTSVTNNWSLDPDDALSGRMDGTGDYTINIGFNIGNLAAGQAKSFNFAYVFVASPAQIAEVIATVPASNPAPTFTAFDAALATVDEDKQVTITHDDLIKHGNEADKNADDSAGSVPAFVVKAVTSGTLKIGAGAETAKAWAVNSNDVIDATNKAYWTPAANANGTLNAFTVVARDADGAVSATPVQATVNVTPVNDAPEFKAGALLTPVLEDAVNPAGLSVDAMLAPAFRDVDAGASLGGIVVIGNGADAAQGKWTYSTDNGATWHPVGSVSDSAGLVLPASAKLRFEAEANWHGKPGSLSVLPVDNAYAGGFSNGATRVPFDSTNDAPTSGVGAKPVAISTEIISVNDAPVFTSAPGAASLTETSAYDDAAAPGKVALAGGSLSGTLSASDVDHAEHVFGIRGAGAADASGIVVKVGFYGTLTLDTATGAWTYAPSNFTAINALGEGKTAADSFDFKVSDPEGAFSLQKLTITLTGTNDLPVLAHALSDQAFSGAGTWTYQLPADSFTDADGTPLSYTVELADGSPLPAWLHFDEASRTFSGDPSQDSGSLQIKVTASDGKASVDDTFTLDFSNTGNQAPYLNKAPLPPVVSDVREQFAVEFKDALGGAELAFDGQTVSLGNLAKPTTVANAVAAGAYANWTVAIKDGTTDTVVFTAKNAGAIADVTDVVNGGTYDGAPVITRVTDGTDVTAGARESFVLNLTEARGGNTMTFDGVTVPLAGDATAEQIGKVLEGTTFTNWTAVATGSQVKFTHKSSGNQPDGDIAQFSGNYIEDNLDITVSNVSNGGPDTPGTAEVFEVQYTGGPGGSTLVFDGTTITAGNGLSAAEVAAEVVAAGATGNWNVAADPLNPGKVVYTANSTGNKTDVVAGDFSGNAVVVTKANDGAGWSYALAADTFLDPEGGALTYVAKIGTTDLNTAGSAALSFNPATLTFSGNGTALPAGAITITATDAQGKSATTSFALTLANGLDNGVTKAGALANVEWTGAGKHSYHLANDAFAFADGGALTLSATLEGGKSLPAWLKFDPATGTFSGNPPAGSEGSYVVHVTASESTGAASTATQEFTLVVATPDDAPVVVSQLPDVVADTSGDWSLSVGKLLFSDPDGNDDGSASTDGIAYSATLANGDPLPSWLTFDVKNGIFSGNPPAGTPYLNVIVKGTSGAHSASTSFTLGLTTDADAAAATNSAGSLTIGGSPTAIGSVLSAGAPVDADGVASTPTYQWQVSSDNGATWSDIGGARATGNTLTLTVAESGKYVRAVSFYNDEGGVAEAPESNAIAIPKFNVQGTVTLAGTQSPGQILTALVSDQNGLSKAAPGYQWQVSTDGVNFTDISGATYSAYTLANEDGGKYVRVNVTYSDDEVSAENIYSAPTKQLDLGMVAPNAVDDTATAQEAGGVDNKDGGANASGNLLANDTDANKDDTHAVTSVRAGAVAGLGDSAESGAAGFTIAGLYGTLTVKADGSYTYVVDQTNFAVNALNTGAKLTESFNYTVTDNTELSGSAVLTVTINGANDAPTVIFAPEKITAVEDLKTGFVMPSLFSLSDVDGGTAFSVQLLASAGKLSGISGGGVTVSGNDSGVLTLTGSMTAVNAWLKTAGNAFYTGAPNANGNAAATITLTANDGSGYKPMGSPMVVDITATNDAAILDLDADNSSGADGNNFITTFRPRGEAVAVVDGDVTITDVDAAAVMAGARIAITGGAWDNDFGTTYETLASTVGAVYKGSLGNITISGNGTTVVTLSGAGTMADYQNALKTIRYDNANPNAFAGDRTITISVTDTSAAKLVTLATPTGTIGAGMSVLLGGVDTGATVTQVIDGSHFVTSTVVAGLATGTALSFATGATAATASAGVSFSTVELNEAIAVGQKIFVNGADSGLTVSAVAGSLVTASGAITLAADAALSFRTDATGTTSGLVSNSGSFTTAASNNLIAVGQKIYIGGVDSGQTVAAVLDNQHFVASGPLNTLTPTSAMTFHLNGNLVTSATNAAPLAATTTIKTPWTPVVDLDGAASSGRDRTTTFTEGQSGVAIATSDASITDQDGNLKTVVVTLTNPVDGSAEKLFISDGLKANLLNLGITTTISANGHVLTFAGDKDATYYQLGLRGVQYQNASENPGVTPRVITVAVTDMDNNAGVNAQTTINVVPVNDAPVIAINTGATVLEGGSVTLTTAHLASTDVDDAAATLDYVVTTAPTKGTLFRDLNNNNQVDAGEALGTGGKFTQGELAAGIVKYAQADTLGGSATPYGSDSFGFKVQDGLENGAVAPSGTFNLAITPVNDAPLLSGVASNPTFTENGADPLQGGWATLFTGVAVNPVENAQHVIEVRFSVAGVADGSAEKIRIDGQEVSLANASGTTSAGSFGYAVNVSNGVATVVVSKAGAANADWKSLLDSVAYRNTSNAPSGTARTVTLTQVKDDGGTANGGVDTTKLNLSSSVAIVASDSAPTMGVNSGASVANGGVVTLGNGNLALVDSDSGAAALKYTVTSAPANGVLFRDLNGNGKVDASEMLGKGAHFTQQDINDGRIKYMHNGEAGTSESFKFTAGDAKTTLPEASFTIAVGAPVSDVGVDGGGTNTPSTDGRSPLFKDVEVNPKAGDTVGTLTFTIGNVKDGAKEVLTVNGRDLPLTDGFTETVDGIVYTVHVDGAGKATVTVTDPSAPGFSGAQAEDIIAGVRYTNSAVPPTAGLRPVSLEVTTIDVDGAPTGTHPVDFDGSIMINPTKAPFPGADLPTPPAGSSIETLTFNISPVKDGDKEVFKVNGRELPLKDGYTVTDNNVVYKVSVDADGKATVTVTKVPGFTETQAETVVRNATYVNNAVPPSGEPRTLTLDSLTETNGATPPVKKVIDISGIEDTFVPSTINHAPDLIVGPDASVLEGGVLTLKAADLSATDADQSGGSLLFKLDAAPAHGVLFRDTNGNGLVNTGEKLAAGATFTQADLVAGRIKYAHDGSEGATDGIQVSVSDGLVSSAAKTLSFDITPVNDAPTLSVSAQNPGFTEGGAAAQLFNSAAAAGIEAGQRVTGLKMTVEQLRDGVSEQLVINGQAVELSGNTAGGSLGTVDGVALSYSVSFAGGTATVQVNAAGGIAEADLLALVNNLRYQNTSANPSEGKRTITLTELSDNGGTANGGLDKATLALSSSVTVTAVNSAPTLSSPGVTVLEGGSLTMTTTQFNAADPDSPLSSLVYKVTSAPSAGTLFVDLNNDGLLSIGEALANNGSFTHDDLTSGRVRYQHDGSENGDSFGISVGDGSASSAPVTVAVNRTPVNDAPVLGSLNGSKMVYPANSGVKSIAREISVTDSDSDNFDGGQLRVSIQSNNDAAKDVLSLADAGTGAGQIGISGASVTFGGIVIGTVAGGSGANDLVITLNANATPAATEALIRAVQFSNTDANPAAPARSIGFTLLDGDGGVSQTASVDVVIPTNTQPIILNGSGFYVAENTTAVTVMSATDPHGRPVTYSISGGADAGKFVINPTTGTLRFATAPDFEQPGDVGADNVYNVKVRATNDEGSYSESELVVNLVDVVDETAQDDAAPAFGFATVNGNRLVMSYTDQSPLDAVNLPPASAFSVVSAGRANAVTSVVVDAVAKTVTLTLSSAVANGAAVTVAYTDPTTGNDVAALQDSAGNDVASMGATAVTNLTPGASTGGGGVIPVVPPVTTPGNAPGEITNVTTVVERGANGESTTTNTGMIGTVRVVETVYVNTNGSTEKSLTVAPNTNAAGPLTLPLLYEAGGTTASNTTVSLSAGVGLTSFGARTPMGTTGSLDLIELIKTSVSDADSLLANMVSGGLQFLDTRPASATLWVNKIVLNDTSAGSVPSVVTVNGAANNSQSVTTGDKLEGLVIDASSLKPGSTLNLQNVDFAVVIGDNIKIRGGDGQNVVYGGAGSQDIMLGADDDVLYGGDGDDTIGSAGGNDMIFGNAGNDTLFGGAGLDVLHGGKDTDVAVYEGNMDRYSITRDHGKTIVRSLDRLDDIDTLVNVESIRFADQTYKVENSAKLSMIASAYGEILDRQADLNGFQFWATNIEAGTVTSGRMGMFLLESNEFTAIHGVQFAGLSQGQQVEMLYRAILDRDAEKAGYDYWMTQLDQGTSMENVVKNFMESAELTGNYSAPTDWEFIL